MHKDLKKLLKALTDQGFTWEIARNNHITVRRDGAYVCTLPATPSDWRSLRNAVAQLRRLGFEWGHRHRPRRRR